MKSSSAHSVRPVIKSLIRAHRYSYLRTNYTIPGRNIKNSPVCAILNLCCSCLKGCRIVGAAVTNRTKRFDVKNVCRLCCERPRRRASRRRHIRIRAIIARTRINRATTVVRSRQKHAPRASRRPTRRSRWAAGRCPQAAGSRCCFRMRRHRTPRRSD